MKNTYKLIATKTPLNSSVPAHWFNFELIQESEDFLALKEQVRLLFGTNMNQTFGDEYTAVKIITTDGGRDWIVGLWMQIPIEGNPPCIKYFRVMPCHDEIEIKMGPDNHIPIREFDGGELMLRALPFCSQTLLEEGQEPLENHPVFPLITRKFKLLSAADIDLLLKSFKDSKMKIGVR